jgi:glycosyltransferase involved in cell wall biosynthesis
MTKLGQQSKANPEIAVSILTGGADRPYVFGLATALMEQPIALDIVGSDDLDCPEMHGKLTVRFLNLRGSQRSGVGLWEKAVRVLRYYAKLIRYTAAAPSPIFHILWNNKFETFDRTLLMLYYKLLGKKVAFTAHNVNAGKRDGNDTFFNRLTLRIQYRMCDQIFVHTEKMKREMASEFGVRSQRITVIPFGINNAVPNSSLQTTGAKKRLGVEADERTILFFGNITPYKGIEHLVAAFNELITRGGSYRLVIAGKPDKCQEYWSQISEAVVASPASDRITLRAQFIPDEETEVYFKAADVLVLPYTHVYQSGVLFLAHSFGLPVIAADVGSLRDEIVEGKTGFTFKAGDANELSEVLERYFASGLYGQLEERRQEIKSYVAQRNSWEIVGQITMKVYGALLSDRPESQELICDSSKVSGDVDAFS